MTIARLEHLAAPPAWRMLSRSWSCNTTEPRDGAVIFACLHRDILPAIRYCRPARPVLLVSQSADGQILTRTLVRDGFGFVRGSTGHGGREGFVGLLRVLRAGRSVGMAVDGPRGPFGHVHDGALQLARRSGAAIIPLTVTGRGCVQLKTWDRTLVPLPWARLDVRAGEPLTVPADADAEALAHLRSTLAWSLGLEPEVDRADP